MTTTTQTQPDTPLASLIGEGPAQAIMDNLAGVTLARELAEATASVRRYITVTRIPVFDEEIAKADAVRRVDAAMTSARAAGLLASEGGGEA